MSGTPTWAALTSGAVLGYTSHQGSTWVWVAGVCGGLALIVVSTVWCEERRSERDIPPAACTAGPPYESELVEPQDRCQARSAEAGHHCTLDATHRGAHLCGTGCGRGWVL